MLVVGLLAGPGRALAQRPMGIDVSSYQGGGINWTSVKGAGIAFAWSKATEGTGYIDADFAINENNGKAAGVYMGAYHFAHPELNSASAEASYFWNVAGNYIKADGKTLMPMLDIEASAFNLNATALSAWINAWCADVVQDAANAGVSIKPVIYVSACNACGFDGTVGQWFSDIADYNGESAQTGTPWSTCTSCERWGAGGWNFWQYTDAASVSGAGSVDGDVFNGTAATLASTMLATASTNSTIYYWDPQGTAGANPYTGSMTGTWENAKWSYGASGLASTVGWTDGKAACFGVHTGIGTPAYTVTMNSSHVVAGFFDGPLTPNSCDVTIQGSGIIDLASGPQALDSINSSDGSLGLLRINCVIAGNGQLYPEGNGQSFLHGANTYTGGTQLGYHDASGSNPFSGIVKFNNGSAFGTGTITLTTYGTGGALVLEGTTAATVPNAVTVTSATTNNIVGNAAGLTFSGNWSLGANLLALGTGATAGNQTIIAGAMSGTAGLKVYNAGTLVLSGVNTYSGTTTIDSPAVFTIGGAGQLGSGSYAGSIVNNGTFNYNSTASQTLSGVISGTGPLKQNNSGLLALTGVNTYSGGTTVSSGGTLGIAADSALGASTAGLTLNGGCLKNNNSAPTLNSTRTITLGASGGYLDAGWAPASPVTVNSKLTGAGQLLINLDGSPVVLANTANNYTGDTIIGTNGPGYYAPGTQAWLKLGASGVIPNGSGKGNVIIFQTYKGLLDFAGFTQTLNGLSGDGTVNNSTGNGSLSVGNNNQSSTFSGVIKNTGGTLALTKVGSGTQVLSGVNTYSGGTTISAGTLEGGVSGAIPGNVTVSGAGTLKLDDAAAMASSATLTLVSTPGAGAVNLSFTGTQTINALYFGTTQKAAGTWAASGAMHNNAAFAGGGVLNVTTGPASFTALSLTSGSNPSTYGNSLTFTAVVTGHSPGGTVQLIVDGVAVGGPVTLVGGSAPLVISNLAVSGSPHQITASYSGDDNNNPSDSSASPVSQTITSATTAGGFTSSPNPSLPGSNVTFTAMVTNAVATGPAPAGNVQFKTNRVPLGGPVALDGSGVAAFITNSLPHGSNTVSAEYAGDGNFLGLSNTVVQIVNTPPTASGTNAATAQNQALVLSDASLLSIAYDADGDSLSIASAGPTSTNGGTVTLAGGNVTYQPVTNFVGMDLFSFVVSDPYGASATGTVLVTVSLASVPPPYVVVPPTYDSGSGTFQATFTGLPNHTYTIQTAPSPTGPWSFLKTVTTGSDGLIVVTDSDLPPPPARYYRVVYP
jgi:autotransporter-associated beta strand protein